MLCFEYKDTDRWIAKQCKAVYETGKITKSNSIRASDKRLL